MEITQLLKKVAAVLRKLKVSYIVTGGVAVTIWGRARYTADIDIVIKIMPQNMNKLRENLLKIDSGVYLDIDKNISLNNFKTMSGFNLIHSKSGLKVDFIMAKDDKFSSLEIKKSVEKKFAGQKISFISPENLILSKLLWHKESNSTRHLEDIGSILKISKVDLKYIEKWANRQSTLKIFKKILKKTK